MFEVNEYQKQFREKLTDEFKVTFDGLVGIANAATTVDEVLAQLPEEFGKALKGTTTIPVLVGKIFEMSSWATAAGPVDYKEPKSALSPKSTAPKKAAKVSAAPKPIEIDPATGLPVVKKRGNADALARARARDGATTEQLTADKALILATIVEFLTAQKGVVVHVKTICEEVAKSLAGKLTNGAGTNDGKVYEVIQAAVKSGNAPFTGAALEGRKKGYTIA